MARNGGDCRLLKCPVCASETLKPAHVKTCSRECANVHRRQSRRYACRTCGESFTSTSFNNHPARQCEGCRSQAKGQRIVMLTCPVCGVTGPRQARYRTCSRRCGNLLQWQPRKRWQDRRTAVLAKCARRRMRMVNPDGRVEAISVHEIAERDGWSCHLCSLPVDAGLKHPDPASASVDHVTPLSRGGEHTADNVRLAHLQCNVRRGARDISRAVAS